MTGSRRLGALATAIASLAWAATAQAAGFLPVANLTDPVAGGGTSCGFLGGQGGIGPMASAQNAQGDTIVVWSRDQGANAQMLQAAVRPAGGSFGSAQNIGLTQPCDLLGILGVPPAVAIDSSGNAVVVFEGTDANTKTVAEASFRPAGGSFSSPVELSTNTANLNDPPLLAMAPDGTAVATWTLGSSPAVVQVAARPAGGSFGAAVTLSDNAQAASSPAVAINSSGAAAVTWQRSNGTNQIAQVDVRPAGTSAFHGVKDLSATGQDAAGANVAIDSQGRATAVWQRFDGTQQVVQSRFLTSAGELSSGADNLSQTGRDGSNPVVALDSSNNAVAIWDDCPTGQTDGCVVEAALRPSNGSFGNRQPISAPGNSQFLVPQLVVDPAGNTLAAWGQFNSTAAIETSIKAAGATSFGGVVEVSDTNVGNAYQPFVSVDGEGNTVLVWPLIQTSDSKYVAQYDVYDVGNPAVGSVSVPGSATRGDLIAMSASGSDRWSPVTLAWDFGDGATATGASVSHIYGSSGVFTVKVTATDGAGNSVNTTRTIQINDPPPPPPTPRVTASVTVQWQILGSKFTLKKLSITGAPVGATVEIRCSGKKCPFKRKVAKKSSTTSVNALKALTKKQRKRLRAGQTLEVRITISGSIGKVVRYKLKKGKIPNGSNLCIPLGKTSPQATCP